MALKKYVFKENVNDLKEDISDFLSLLDRVNEVIVYDKSKNLITYMYDEKTTYSGNEIKFGVKGSNIILLDINTIVKKVNMGNRGFNIYTKNGLMYDMRIK